MKTPHIFALVYLAASLVLTAAPRLVVSTPSLTPESQIDLVFDSPVVDTSELGKTIANTWLDIQPAIPGKLLWKAQNIANFIPEQAPTIGATYTFSIPKNRNHLDKSPVPAGKFATLASEPFRIVAASAPRRWASDYSPSTAEWMIVFNDDVSPTAAANFVTFSSKSGQRVAARLEQATVARAGYYANRYKPWASRFPNSPDVATTPESPAPNILVVSPISPLPVGEEWIVSLLKGLPNQSASARTTEDNTYQIGNVEPFRASSIKSHQTVNDPREIFINFNQPLPEFLPVDFLTKCITISPRPENLSAQIDNRTIRLTGNFDEVDKYSVSFRPPFTSRAGLDLEGPLKDKIEFGHFKPVIGFPSEDQGQLANGSRRYRMLTLNLESARLKIKKLSGLDRIRAFQGYRHFTGNGPNNDNIQPTSVIPYSLIVGQPMADMEIPLDNPIDTTKTITLNWDEILPKDLRYGTFFVEASGKVRPDYDGEGLPPTTQSIVQLTDIGLAWKITSKEVFVYAFSCDTGTPLSDVKLEIYGEDATALQSATTDASGVAVIPKLEASRHLHASLGEDDYLTAFDSSLDTVGLWHFPIRYSWNKSAETTRRAFLFTDRSLYRPGETVRLKGIIRNLRGNAIEPSDVTPARIVVVDPTDKEIHSSPVSISESGSFDFTYTLPTGKTGSHTIRFEYPEELALAETLEDDWERQYALNQSARFELPLNVEEFRRNAFEVGQTIAPPAPGAISISADLTAKYYQGQPVAAGKVDFFSRITAQNPYPERFRDFLFGNHRTNDWSYWYHYFGYRSDGDDTGSQSSQIQGETQLSADGQATLAVAIPQAEFPTTRQVTISAEVTDANNQTLTSTASTTVHPASVYIGVSRIDQLVRAGENLPLKIVATNTEGEPFPGAVKVTATLTREVNNTVKTRTDSGATATRNDVTEETIITSELNIDPAASAAQGTPFVVTPKSTGRHILTLRGTDPEGREFATVTYFHVYGTNEYPWLYEDGLRVKLVAEKKSYQPGETARILVLTPIEGTALVTVEREKVLRSFLVPLKADNPVIEIPLTDDDAPNAFVSVLIVKGARESAREFKEPQLRLGYCELIVENLRDRLAVNLEAPSSCRPGDDITLTGSVMLANGRPAAQAEVTLYAEDEGTLAVMGYETPKPMDYFYKPRVLDVETGTSFANFIAEDPEQQAFYNKGFFIGGGGDWSKLEDLLRKNFDPCATWAPSLVTDAEGKFTHTFKFPDTLTRYRLIAVAQQDAARFGHVESSIVVKKDLMLEPKTPRFANQADTFNSQVLVQNASTHTGTWEIKFSTSNDDTTPCAVPTGPTTETVTLAPGASTTVIFPTRADTTGEAVLTFRATPVSLSNASLTPELTHNLSDAVESRFAVQYPMPLLRQTKLVTLKASDSMTNLRDQLDGRLLDGSGEIELEFARSPLIEAAGSVDYLLHYPYGCVEQTTSSLIPWLAVEDLRPIIPRFAKMDPKKVTEAIQAGADRLLSMQLADGSFAYWPGNTQAVTWATSYAGMGLIMASNKGANVPESAIESLQKYLIESLRGIANEKSAYALECHTRSLLVLAIAGAPQPAYRNVLVDRIAELTPSARCLLATAIAAEDKDNAANLSIAKSVLTSSVPFKQKNDDWMPWSANDAYSLIAWLAIDPDGSEPTKALDRMLHERNPYGAWRTTWVNGWSLLAMAAYAQNQELNNDPVALAFETNSGTETISLTEEHPTSTRSFKLTPDLKLAMSADNQACVRMKIAAKPQIMPSQPVAKNGLSIDRIYERINGDGSATILTEPQVGDLIRVSLRVTLPQDRTRYLVIEDPLPSLFETVNTDFKSQRAAVGVSTSKNDWQVSHSELRTDRAVFFLDEVWRKGTYTLTYLARCTVSGQATAPPAKVESMYDPENFALSASRVFLAK